MSKLALDGHVKACFEQFAAAFPARGSGHTLRVAQRHDVQKFENAVLGNLGAIKRLLTQHDFEFVT